MNKDPKHCQQPSCSPTDLYSLLLIFTSIHLCLNSGKLAGKSLSLPRIKNKFGSTWGGGDSPTVHNAGTYGGGGGDSVTVHYAGPY